MSAPALLSFHDAHVTFGGKPLFDGLSLNLHARDRISLVGKNGAGKSTLMQMITGERELDGGERWVEPGVTIGYLQQDVQYDTSQTVFDFLFAGLKKEHQHPDYAYKVEQVLEPLELDGALPIQTLSGGQLRRAALGRALVEEPDILLLDEPTNHLDLAGIEWLEEFLLNYRGTLLCVSHDKYFLSTISNKVFWLDRSRIRICPKGFKHFDTWSEELLAQEARELQRRERILAGELEWANRGVKARRKRNQQRLENVRKEREKLKADKSSYHQVVKKIELPPLESSMASRVVAEFHNVSKSYEEHGVTILDRFNFRMMRGDRIGILGKNGSGKTSFLKLLVGEEQPGSGKVKMAHGLEFSYFDQKRSDLNPQHSLWETLCPNGGDYVEVAGKSRHVCGYLKSFLFDPKIAKDKVSTLSGGQQNRLLLAKVLASPGNFLILDEPTNDLDMDTLDMLEDILAAYQGTLLIVSHDRDFLDQTVTKVLAFEGDGDVQCYIGGYSDYLEAAGKKKKRYEVQAPEKPKAMEHKAKPKSDKKLSYKLQYELEHLPQKMSALEDKLRSLQEVLADTDLYTKDPDAFHDASTRYESAKQALEQAEERWLELESLKE